MTGGGSDMDNESGGMHPNEVANIQKTGESIVAKGTGLGRADIIDIKNDMKKQGFSDEQINKAVAARAAVINPKKQ